MTTFEFVFFQSSLLLGWFIYCRFLPTAKWTNVRASEVLYVLMDLAAAVAAAALIIGYFVVIYRLFWPH